MKINKLQLFTIILCIVLAWIIVDSILMFFATFDFWMCVLISTCIIGVYISFLIIVYMLFKLILEGKE